MENILRNIIKQNLKKSILEDYSNFDKEVGKKLFNRKISIFLKNIDEKFGIKFKKFLVSSYYGFAFLSKDNKTIKITTDKTEAIMAKKLMNNDFKHLPKVYNIYKINISNSNLAYVIVKDHILQNKDFINLLIELGSELKVFLKLFQKEENYNFPHNMNRLLSDLNDNSIKFEEFQKFIIFLKERKANVKVIWYFQQLYFIYNEIHKLGISSEDARPENLGLKNKNLIYLDIGAGRDDGKESWVDFADFNIEINH